MYKSITPLHGEYNEWIGKLSFYNDDLKIMRKWLNDVVERNNSKDFFKELKHFQNEIRIQQDQIDLLKYEISENEILFTKSGQYSLTGQQQLNTHPTQREKIAHFEELFRAMRKAQMIFLGKWM